MNEQITNVFLVESEELLSEMESQLMTLETSLEDEYTINALFRVAHTLKGAAGIIGIETIEKFTHWVENFLELVRQKKITLNLNLIDLLFKAQDHLIVLHGEIADGEDSELNPELREKEQQLIKEFQHQIDIHTDPEKASEAPLKKIPPSMEIIGANHLWDINIEFGESTFRDGFDPASFIAFLTKLGKIMELEVDWSRLPTLKESDPESCYLNVSIIFQSDREQAEIENVFEFIKEDSKIKVEQLVLEDQKQKEEVESKTLIPAATRLNEETTSIEAGAVSSKSSKKTIRIEIEKLDQLVDLVGELVIASANATEQANRLNDEDMQESIFSITRLVEEIRERSMQTRMVPIEQTFTRFHRIIRDISREMGKKIQLEVQGSEVEVDKNVIEKIVDPLMHLVRNSIDHGIEPPARRKEIGKSEVGTVLLKASYDSGNIVIEIKDDGGGIDPAKVADRAINMGLIQEQHSMSQHEIINLIFHPGFSTAEKVTKISGRGVGMDVVKNNIESLRGTVSVDSKIGEYSTFRISLPPTMAIIDGLLVSVGDAKYVIPLDMVVECISLPEEAHKNLYQVLNLRGYALPYLSLREIFEETGPSSDFPYIVIVKHGEHLAGLVVDALHGEIQAVMKSLGKAYQDVHGFSGATILGNGDVSLILDIPKLIYQAERDHKEKYDTSSMPSKQVVTTQEL